MPWWLNNEFQLALDTLSTICDDRLMHVSCHAFVISSFAGAILDFLWYCSVLPAGLVLICCPSFVESKPITSPPVEQFSLYLYLLPWLHMPLSLVYLGCKSHDHQWVLFEEFAQGSFQYHYVYRSRSSRLCFSALLAVTLMVFCLFWPPLCPQGRILLHCLPPTSISCNIHTPHPHLFDYRN